jgi:hypothetical protein
MYRVGQQEIEDGVFEDVETDSVALVPTVEQAEWAHPPIQLPKPDPSFLTHLIATAEQVPQTRPLRRATPADARTAYQAHPAAHDAGTLTLQII